MLRLSIVCLPCSLLLFAMAASPSSAQLTSRAKFHLRGDAVLIGNTLGQDTATGVPAPVVGTVGASGINTADSAPDVFWRSNSPAVGQATANTSVTVSQARSTAVLSLQPGEQVRYARLYWAATSPIGSPPDTTVTLTLPGNVTATVTADATYTYTGASPSYLGTADVTNLVVSSGSYTVGDVNCINLVDLNSSAAFTGWAMVVVFESPALPVHAIEIADGFAFVDSTNTPLSYTFSGFVVPPSFSTSSLSLLAFETDATITGDSLIVDGSTYSDALNPATNFFNGTHSRAGVAVSNSGDLPQLTGGINSMSGMDLDEIHPTPTAGQTSRTISAQSTGDTFLLGVLVHSVSTLSVSITSIKHLPSGDVQIMGQSDSGSVQISASPNPTTGFTPIATVAVSGGTFTYTDVGGANSRTRRFYQANLP